MDYTTVVFVLVVLFKVQHSTSSLVRERESTYDLHQEQLLMLPLQMEQKSIQVDDAMEGVFACTSIYWCLSINFKTTPLPNGRHVCELLSSVQFSNATDMKQDKEYNHYSTKTACHDKPCHNGGICVYYDVIQDYRCNCSQAFYGKNCENEIVTTTPQPTTITSVGSPLGMESRAISDDKITASTVYLQYYPYKARLNLDINAWAPSSNSLGQWIQVDLSSVTTVTAIATQGRYGGSNWVKTYSLLYSMDGTTFTDYEGGKIFVGNTDQQTVVKNAISPPISARYIRVFPKTWNGYMQLRMELYG